MAEIERNLSPEDRETVSTDLRILREWIGGAAAPWELINAHNFPALGKHAPESLEMFRNIGEGGFALDQQKLEMRDKYPEAWSWPDEKERTFLQAAIAAGVYDQALEDLKKDYQKRVSRHPSSNQSGFPK